MSTLTSPPSNGTSDPPALKPNPPFSSYQLQIYTSPHAPLLSTSLQSLQSLAQEKLEKAGKAKEYWYVAGGAGSSTAHTQGGSSEEANVRAFAKWGLLNRVLVDANKRDLTVTLGGTTYSSPIIIAPIGVGGAFHEEGELAVARAARKVGIPFALSTASTRSIEAVAEANGSGGHRWYQLYWPKSEDITASLLTRAQDNGYTHLILTLDTTLLGYRPNDLDTPYLPFLDGIGCMIGFSDPVFCKKVGIEVCRDWEEVMKLPEGERKRVAREWLGEVNSGIFRNWDDFAIIRKHWSGPIYLKGLTHPHDAHIALSHPIALRGLIISNHGGRQVPGQLPALDSLVKITSDPLVAQWVREKGGEILFDSGIRDGGDVVKALALGAKAVLLGRPWVWGMILEGERGVEHVLRSILCEVETTIALMGCPNIRDLDTNFIERIV